MRIKIRPASKGFIRIKKYNIYKEFRKAVYGKNTIIVDAIIIIIIITTTFINSTVHISHVMTV